MSSRTKSNITNAYSWWLACHAPWRDVRVAYQLPLASWPGFRQASAKLTYEPLSGERDDVERDSI